MSIEIQGVAKAFDGVPVLRDIDLSVPSGSLVALLGPSGCGKTTLLRIIAGLEVPDAGVIRHGDDEIATRSARDRNVGLVFQHYALFRHMTVAENVAFALRVRRRSRPETTRKVSELLSLVQLEGFERRYPHQLSGGQRQRVALARALATEPRVLLLDEPFGALDARVRHELRRWLRQLHDELHVTSLFVTHDQEEAFEVADRVVLMNHGRIEQQGTPTEVFEEPASAFVMRFLGAVNVFHGREHGERVYVRPHELEVHRAPAPHTFPARVQRLVPLGSAVRVELSAPSLAARIIEAELDLPRSAALALHPGDTVHLSPRRVRVFPADAQELDSLTASAL